jgi:hypothetical protein
MCTRSAELDAKFVSTAIDENWVDMDPASLSISRYHCLQ